MSQRRLAAIMFTDIVGYDSLLKEDEKKAFDHLKKNQRIHRRLIKKFNGRWLKEMGEGILASFNSNIDAVMCAVSINKATKEIEIPVRIGIHQGDVIFEKKDVLGDGVNVASRIQSLIETNGIVISETVYNDIKNKDGLDVESLGERPLKGVTKPVEIYTVTCKDESLLDFTIDTGELVRPFSFGRKMIAIGIIIIALLAYALFYFLTKFNQSSSEFGRSVLVLPFDNYLGSDTLEYFVAGMHNSLIGEIGKISALQVKSKTTANVYKDTEKSLTEIAKESGVDTFLEGSVLCLGDSICLQVKLMSVYPEEKQLWVQDFKVEKSQILKLYSTVTKDFSDKINVILTPEEENLLSESRLVDNEAYDLYMKGQFYMGQISDESLKKAIEYYKLAIEKDPYWAAPYAGLAEVGSAQKQMGFVPISEAEQLIYENLNKALELDSNSFISHYGKAIIAAWTEFDWKKSEEEFQKALELNPSHVRSHIFYAHVLLILRRTDEALFHGKKAQELDPFDPFTLGLYARILMYENKSQEALVHIEKGLSIEPDHYFTFWTLVEAYSFLKEYDKWFELWKTNECWNDELKAILEKVYYEHGYNAFVQDLLRLHKEYENDDCWMRDYAYSQWYMTLQDYDKALDYLESMYEKHNPNLPYQFTNYYYDKMKDNPRYIALLEKMNLPVD